MSDERNSVTSSGEAIPFFKEGEDALLLDRETTRRFGITEDLTEEEREVAEYLRTIASDENIAGVVLSRIRISGGIYTTVVVKDLEDSDTLNNTFRKVSRSFDHLRVAGHTYAGPHSYVRILDRTPVEFIRWFKEEFHKPLVDDQSGAFFGAVNIAGSSESLEWLGSIMFE